MSVERRVTATGAVRFVARVKSGRQLVATKTFQRKGDAEDWEREQRRALKFGEFIPPRLSGTPFSEVAEQFLESRRGQVSPHSWRTDRDNISNIPAWFAARPISSIGQSEILSYLTEQLAVRARSTVQRARTTLGTVFAYAVRERLISRNPMREVRMPPGERSKSTGIETFTPDELADTLARQAARDENFADVTEFLSLTGLRWSEMRALRVADVRHTPFPAVRVARAHSDGYAEKSTKTGRVRLVPLTARAREIVAMRIHERPATAYLFTTRTGLQIGGTTFRKAIRWSETTPPGRTIHDLRHYAASDWLRAGIPVNQVSQWLGHANPNMTLAIYAHVLGDDQNIAAIAHLDNFAADGRRAARASLAPPQPKAIDGPDLR